VGASLLAKMFNEYAVPVFLFASKLAPTRINGKGGQPFTRLSN
jgi:hypothetical protein